MHSIRNHFIFWLFYISFTVGIYQVKDPSFWMHLTYEMVSLPAKMLLVYFTLYFILPRFLLPKQYIKALFTYAVMLVISVWFLYLSVSQVVYPTFYPNVATSLLPHDYKKLISPLLDLIIVSSLALVLKLLKDREQQDRNRLQLEKLNIQNELQLLKSQLHPHFLFNTLNGLYAYTLEEPKVAAQMLIKLSNLLRFIIYEGNKSIVYLQDELDCMNNYMELERLRYGKKLQLDYQVTGEIGSKKIVPLLLLPFLENAFKHGTGKRKKADTINCKISIHPKSLNLYLANSKKEQDQLLENSSGIGLQNVQQRLRHHFGEAYQLNIKNYPGQFLVNLNIPLSYEMCDH